MSDQEAIVYIERRIATVDACRAGGGNGYTGNYDQWNEFERPFLVTCLHALRAQQDEPKLPSGTLRIGQRISGKIVALDAERGLASIKWETSVHAPEDERKRITRFKGVKYRPGEILSANELLDGYIYWLVTNDQVAFKCPCGCGNLVLLDISPTMRSHKWKFQEVRAGYITLEPSIHSESTCGSHYYIRENQILWMN